MPPEDGIQPRLGLRWRSRTRIRAWQPWRLPETASHQPPPATFYRAWCWRSLWRGIGSKPLNGVLLLLHGRAHGLGPLVRHHTLIIVRHLIDQRVLETCGALIVLVGAAHFLPPNTLAPPLCLIGIMACFGAAFMPRLAFPLPAPALGACILAAFRSKLAARYGLILWSGWKYEMPLFGLW